MNKRFFKMSTEITTISTMTPAEIFSNEETVDAIIQKVENEVKNFVPDLSTAKGRKEIASFANRVTKTKTFLDGEGKKLGDELRAKLDPILAQRKKFRDRLDELKAEARKPLTDWEAKEKARIETLTAKVDLIKNAVDCEGLSSSLIKAKLDDMKKPLEGDYGDLADEAESAREFAELKIESAYNKALNAEREAEEAKKAKEAEEEKARKLELAKEEERKTQEAFEKAEQAKIDLENAKQEKIKAEQLEQERIKQAELDKAQAVEDAKKEAEAKRIEDAKKAEEATAKAVQAEKDRAEKEKQDAINAENARLAEEKRKSEDKEYRRGINKQAVSDLMAHGALSEENAQNVLRAIIVGDVSAVSIKY